MSVDLALESKVFVSLRNGTPSGAAFPPTPPPPPLRKVTSKETLWPAERTINPFIARVNVGAP